MKRRTADLFAGLIIAAFGVALLFIALTGCAQKQCVNDRSMACMSADELRRELAK